MGFGNLSDFSNKITTGRLLNHAFKKQEILQPSKMRLHDMFLRETDNGWDLPYLVIHNPGLEADFSIVVNSSTKRPYRVNEIVLDGELDVRGIFSRKVYEGNKVFSGTASIGNVKIRGDQLENYYAKSVRFFFDVIYSVTNPKVVDTHEKWHHHVFGVAQRHKWN